MKHIGWCLDQIQIVMMHIPKEVISQDGKNKANEILNQVQEYADTLAVLITNPEFKKIIYELESASIEEVRLEAHEIKELFKDLEHILYTLKLYIEKLREIIIDSPEEWSKMADQIVHMIDQKFGGERGELRAEFQRVLHTEERLKGLISSLPKTKELKNIIPTLHHLEEFLK